MPDIDLNALLDRCGLAALRYVDDRHAWQTAWQAAPYQLMTYAPGVLDYQVCYLRESQEQLQDLSLVLMHDGRPCGVFPLLLTHVDDHAHLSGNGSRITPPLFAATLPAGTIKKLCARLMQLLRLLATSLGCQTLLFEQPCMPPQEGRGQDDWYRQWLAAGAAVSVKHDLFADLQRPLADVRSSFRKSYKALINTGLRAWQVQLLDAGHADAAAWEEFKQLHITVAGRRTRADVTWAYQLDWIRQGWAFAVLLRDPADGRLVGGGFIEHTRDEAMYGVGVYDRTLFDKPLGHVVQQVAIERLVALGIPWYRLGERSCPQDQPAPSAKQVAISDFKQGFASHLFTRLELALPVDRWAAAEPSAA
ncbi:FemAB family protein [Pelomonas cellulosilytica]|uniref:FemAB family protein n=1 Tax=Pelomonas cellulosilytica TaxID=2906762 RepID=A0ABS8XZ69_9BURK|nr:FemAB family protein [Pelomonas sp. P8]MCE4556122.1 FemAB family protein [Pelomonas sp. P8]